MPLPAKPTSGDNLINLFNEEYQKAAGNNARLAPLFITRSNGAYNCIQQ